MDLFVYLLTATEEPPHWPIKDEDSDATAPVHLPLPPKEHPLPVETDVQQDYEKQLCE